MAQKTLLASAARTTTTTAEFSRGRAKFLIVVVDATASAATPSVVPTIDGYDSLADKWFNLLTGAAITGTVAARALQIGPGLTAAANLAVSAALPSRLRVVMTAGDADSLTYSISAHLL